MKLASMQLTAEDVLDRGGINAAARGNRLPKPIPPIATWAVSWPKLSPRY